MTGLLLILSCSHFDTLKDQWTWLVMPGYGCHVGTELGWADGTVAGSGCDPVAPSSQPDATESEGEFCASELPENPNPETSFLNECVSTVEEASRECYALAYAAAYYQAATADCDVCAGGG